MSALLKRVFEDRKAIECSRCGNCCRIKGSVFISEKEKSLITAFLEEKRPELNKDFYELCSGRIKLKDNTGDDCIFFSLKDGCMIYPLRPKQCASFPVWLEIISSESNLNEAASYCSALKNAIDNNSV